MSLLRLVMRILREETEPPIFDVPNEQDSPGGHRRRSVSEATESTRSESTSPIGSRQGSTAQALWPKQGSASKKNAAWVPPGEAVAVQGRRIPDGMIYVGSGLPGMSRYVGAEPSLIDPRLPVDDWSPDVHGRDMSYWPSYSEMTTASRAAFLNWLAESRPGGAYIGYVFLFFYGIERRVLIDLDCSDPGSGEVGELIAEVERLLALYGENNSFGGYAGRFLSFVNCLRSASDPVSLEPPKDRTSWELPLDLKLGIGSLVASGQPVPAPWALSWLRLHPEIALRTPAVRCGAEFDETLPTPISTASRCWAWHSSKQDDPFPRISTRQPKL